MHRNPLAILTQHCAYQTNGIRISVVYPYHGGYAVANYAIGGYPVIFPTVDAAKANVEFRNPNVTNWQQEEVPQ